MRMRPRLSRPSKHGIIYLETFGIQAMLDGAAAVALVSVDWSLSALEFVVDALSLRPGDSLALAYAMVTLRSIRGPLAEWGWRRGRGICRDIAIGVAAGIVMWVVYRLPGRIAAIDTLHARMVLGSVLLAPLVEETLYRGALYRYLRDRMQWLPTAILSATIFALAHGSSQMPTAYLMGLGCALLREWRGSLVAPVAMHMSWNLLALAAAGWLTD
jgi:membrane protease YdiL (CAAX protease family)